MIFQNLSAFTIPSLEDQTAEYGLYDEILRGHLQKVRYANVHINSAEAICTPALYKCALEFVISQPGIKDAFKKWGHMHLGAPSQAKKRNYIS